MTIATIRIHDLKVRAIIGTHAWERDNKQDLILNVTIAYDAAKAAQSDAIKDALDYQKVADRAMATIEKSKGYLLEKLAARILKEIMADSRVRQATVRLDKPHAIGEAKGVSVEMSEEGGLE